MGEHISLMRGRFLLQDKLGEGGMAQVFRAYDHRLQVWRAVKLLLPEYAKRQKLRLRFETEAQAMALLEHPNIVRVYDVGSDPDHTWIVMELCDGGSMEGWLAEHGPLPPRLAVEVTRQICSGIAAAHARGVVHRDIKPHNVLLTAQGRCKVTDFGIAQIESQALTKTGSVMGTLGFMAPEQRSDSKKVDVRSDVYSVGATLYSLLTDRMHMDLFAASQDAEIMEGVHEALAPVITQATSYDRADRFQSIDELVDALNEVFEWLPADPANTPSLAPPKVTRPKPPPPPPEPERNLERFDFTPAPLPSRGRDRVVDHALDEARDTDPGSTIAPPLPGETLLPVGFLDDSDIPESLRSAAAAAHPDSLVSFDAKPKHLPWVPMAERRQNTPPPEEKAQEGEYDMLYVAAEPYSRPDDHIAPPPTSVTPSSPAWIEPEQQRDLEEDEVGGMSAGWAVKEAAKFLGQIVKAFFAVATEPLRYMAMPILTVVIAVTVMSWLGADSVTSAKTTAIRSSKALEMAVERDAGEIITDLKGAGAQAEMLDAHLADYKAAETEAERAEAISRLIPVMRTQMNTRIPADRDAGKEASKIRRRLEGRIEALDRKLVDYKLATAAWDESTRTRNGRLAVTLGLASRPEKP